MPSHHQVGALDHLASVWGARVTCVWCEDVSAERRAQGWPSLPRPNLQEAYLPPADWESAVGSLTASQPTAVHIFSGLGAYPQLDHALRIIRQSPPARYAVMAETPVLLGWQGWLRRVKSAWHYFPKRHEMLGLLAMGEMAERYYVGCGVTPARIIPYAYQSPYASPSPAEPAGWTRFVYFGQVDHRKGVDLLIHAMACVRAPFTLDIIGDGQARLPLEALVRRLALGDRINFLGTLPSAELQARLPGYAFAVVPSRFDGWGMAINEALQAGLPVLASDRAGASELVTYSGAGAVYPAKSVQRLAELIQARLEDPALLGRERAAALRYRDKLRPQIVGEYLKDALEHMLGVRPTKPSPPWRA